MACKHGSTSIVCKYCDAETVEKGIIMYCPECKTEEGTPHKEDCKLKLIDFTGAEERVNRLIESRKPFTQKEVEQGVEEMEKLLDVKEPSELGDTYDEDTGEYLGQLTTGAARILTTLPVQISIFYEGYWYIFKPQSRYKEEKENNDVQG